MCFSAELTIEGRIYNPAHATEKVSLNVRPPGWAEEWYEGRNGTKSWIFKSPKGAWYQIITEFDHPLPTGRVITENEAVTLMVHNGKIEDARRIFGQEKIDEMEG